MNEKLQALIDGAHQIVFFGGAGVSTESGIPDFRSQDGLYNQAYAYPPEKILSHTFFYENTAEFYRFFFDKMYYPSARPNAAHKKLFELERAGKLSAVVTQNIDGLHQAAGSKKVIELHGSIHKSHCIRCKREFSLYDVLEICGGKGTPVCECGGIIKPDVVLYEEPLCGKDIEAAIGALSQADLLIVGGTSLSVYPAAGLIEYYGGKDIVLINKSATALDSRATLVINAPVGEVLGDIKC